MRLEVSFTLGRCLATALPLGYLGNRQTPLWRDQTWIQTLIPLLTSRVDLAGQLPNLRLCSFICFIPDCDEN